VARRIQTDLSSFDPEQLIDSGDDHRTTVEWPKAVFAHLDALVEVARAKTNRQELAAALVATASADRKALRQALELLRDGEVKDLGKKRI
jgi:hypothetical protein